MPLLCKVVDRAQKTKTKPNEWSERKGKSKQSPFYSLYILAASWSLRIAKNQFYLVEMSPKVREKMTTTTVPNSTILWFRMGPKTTTADSNNGGGEKKPWRKNCHENGNFETESVIIWAQFLDMCCFYCCCYFFSALFSTFPLSLASSLYSPLLNV